MTHTVVGVFDTYAAAEQAQEALLASGFSNDSIHLNAGSTDTGGIPASRAAGAPDSVSAAHTSATTSHEGVMGGIRDFFANLFGSGEHGAYANHYSEAVRRGGAVVSVDVTGPQRVELAKDALSRAGAVDIDDRLAQWRTEGYQDDYNNEMGGYEAGLPADATLSPSGGVRDGSPPNVARRPDAPAIAAGFPGAEHDPVRVYPRGGGGPTPGLPGSIDAFDEQFRDDFSTRYLPEDGAYEEFAPAYRHGYTLANDERYRGKDWAAAEPEIQRDWETRYPGGSWEKFKLAVRHGWERVTRPL